MVTRERTVPGTGLTTRPTDDAAVICAGATMLAPTWSSDDVFVYVEVCGSVGRFQGECCRPFTTAREFHVTARGELVLVQD